MARLPDSRRAGAVSTASSAQDSLGPRPGAPMAPPRSYAVELVGDGLPTLPGAGIQISPGMLPVAHRADLIFGRLCCQCGPATYSGDL